MIRLVEARQNYQRAITTSPFSDSAKLELTVLAQLPDPAVLFQAITLELGNEVGIVTAPRCQNKHIWMFTFFFAFFPRNHARSCLNQLLC